MTRREKVRATEVHRPSDDVGIDEIEKVAEFAGRIHVGIGMPEVEDARREGTGVEIVGEVEINFRVNHAAAQDKGGGGEKDGASREQQEAGASMGESDERKPPRRGGRGRVHRAGEGGEGTRARAITAGSRTR